MSLSIIDILQPLGNFPVAKAEHIQCGDLRLDVVLNASALEISKKASKEYVDEQIASIPQPDVTKSYVDSNFAKKTDIPNVPTKTSQLTNDSGFLTQHQSLANYVQTTDPRLTNARPASDVSSWAKSSTKPTYTKSEIGLSFVDNTADVDKPVSVAQKAALDEKADEIVVSELSDRITATEGEQTILSARMDEFTKLPDGSTTGDAELADGHISYNGKTYENIGGAIRGQASEINNKVKIIEKPFCIQYLTPVSEASANKYWQSNGTKGDSKDFYAFNPIHLDAGTYYYRNVIPSFVWIAYDDGDGSLEHIPNVYAGKIFNQTFTIAKSGTVYVTTKNSADADYNDVVIANYDYPQLKPITTGTQRINLNGNTEFDNMAVTNLISINEMIDKRYWNSSNQLWSADAYAAFRPIHIKKGYYFYSDLTANFTILKPDDGTEEIKPFTSAKSNTVYIPKDGVLYVSVSKNNFDVTKTKISKFADYVKDAEGAGILNSVPSYALVNDVNKNYVFDNRFSESYSPNDVTIDGRTVTVKANDRGITSPTFKTICSAVKVHVDLTFTNGTLPLRVYVQINQTGGSTKFVKKAEFNEHGSCIADFTFDAASYSVYDNAESYQILVWTGAGTIFIVNDFSAYESATYEASELYSSNLAELLGNVVNKVDSISGGGSQPTSNNTKLVDYTGNKYGLLVNADGSLVTYSHVPKKYAVMGNSITCGMDNDGTHGGMFGMAATSADKDWVAYVDSAISEKNPTATYTRVYSSPFEHAETVATAESWIESNKSKFTSDLDLCIIEMGDNVNTEAKRNTFDTTFEKLLSTIRQNSPKCRIIVVGIWFNGAPVKNTMTRGCENYGVEFVDITDLNVTANQATVGDTVTYRDGTTGTIVQSIATHPGDTGMKLIGERVIAKLDM